MKSRPGDLPEGLVLLVVLVVLLHQQQGVTNEDTRSPCARWGSRVSTLPAATASTTWSRKAAATPAKTYEAR
ncbi:hypothetical protein SMICM17S_01403 [Streptomyces microflavus]